MPPAEVWEDTEPCGTWWQPHSLGHGPTASGTAPCRGPVSFSTGHWSLVESHLESRLSGSVGRAWRPRGAQAPAAHCLLSWRYLIGIKVAPLVFADRAVGKRSCKS